VITVAAAFFPIEQIVREVGGAEVRVVALVPAGQEAHEYEPTPKQVAALSSADVVFYFGGGFQPAVEQTVAGLSGSVPRIDLLSGLSLLPVDGSAAGSEEALAGNLDPHVWLDPANMQVMTDVVAAQLADLRPDLAATFAVNAAAYRTQLGDLDQRFRSGLTTCESRVIVTSHRAFAYLAAAFDLTQIAITGVSPLAEPSAKELAAIADLAKANNVTTVFFEQNLPPDLARTIAGEIGATTAELDTIESPSSDQRSAGATYVSLMDANLLALRSGLRCT
jgi:zinc transport system substrate-binding protein